MTASGDALRRPTAPRWCACFDGFAHTTIDVAFESRTIHVKVEPRSDLGVCGFAGEHSAGDGHGGSDWKPNLAIQSADQGDVINAIQADLASDALPSILDAGHGEM